MARPKSIDQNEKKELVAVYYTPTEIKLITKRAQKATSRISPFIRKVTLRALEIPTKN